MPNDEPATECHRDVARLPNAPVAIGGVGGSGTRVVAAILTRLGFFMGHDTNPANDNLAFTLLFKRSALWPLEKNRSQIERAIRIFLNAMYFRQPLAAADISYLESLADAARFNAPREWLLQRVRRLVDCPAAGGPPEIWGWKEPNTHIFLPSLVEQIPRLRYIHVMRHGLDMAYSKNQAQLQFWGEALTGIPDTSNSPEDSFRYWCAVHSRVARAGKRMGNNFLLLNFDEFCTHPDAGLEALLQFLGKTPDTEPMDELTEMVVRPDSIGRYLGRDRISASARDIELLQALGFSYYPDDLRNSTGQQV